MILQRVLLQKLNLNLPYQRRKLKVMIPSHLLQGMMIHNSTITLVKIIASRTSSEVGAIEMGAGIVEDGRTEAAGEGVGDAL